jgi:hypothetical protein
MDRAPFLFLRVIWDAHKIRFPLDIVGANIKELHVVPEPSHPFGRKGMAIAGAWKQLQEPDMSGILLLDGDVLIDPYDYIHMLAAIYQEPTAAHIAPVKLWPISKGDLDGWAWGHCRNNNFSQEMELNPDFFAFNFTYVPRKAIELAIARGLKSEQFPHVDQFVSRAARDAGIRMHVVEACQPKHLHY